MVLHYKSNDLKSEIELSQKNCSRDQIMVEVLCWEQHMNTSSTVARCHPRRKSGLADLTNCSWPENWWQFGRILPSEEHFFLMNSITLWCFQGNEHNNQITEGFFLSAAFISIERRPFTRQVDAPPMVRDSLSLPPSLPLPPLVKTDKKLHDGAGWWHHSWKHLHLLFPKVTALQEINFMLTIKENLIFAKI